MTLDTTAQVHDTHRAVSWATPIAEITPAARLTPAEEARTLVHGQSRATLSTLALDPAGHPFGSVAPYAVDNDGTPVVFISELAEHTRNLTADPRASLLVAAPPSLGDPMDTGRVTLLGVAARLVDDDVTAAREQYLDRHPDAAAYVDYGDFAFWALHIYAIRWVGGFGRMAWCDPADYRAAQPDPLADIAPAALSHLNTDHPDALLDIARAFTGHPDATAATAVRVDRHGLDLDIRTPRGPATGRAPFAPEPTAPAELRTASVVLSRAARERLADRTV